MKALLLILLAIAAYGFQEAPEGNPAQASCDNYRTTVHKCHCGRAMMCGRDGHGGGDPDAYKEGPNKCQKFCDKKACMCLGPCTSRN